MLRAEKLRPSDATQGRDFHFKPLASLPESGSVFINYSLIFDATGVKRVFLVSGRTGASDDVPFHDFQSVSKICPILLQKCLKMANPAACKCSIIPAPLMPQG